MANLLLGAATNLNYDQLKYWAKSFREVNTKDDIVLLVFNMDEESKTKLRDIGVTVVEQTPLVNNMPIHTLRFIHFKNYLIQNKEKYEFSNVLITDTRDVVFQSDPFYINLDGQASIAITSEGLNYSDEPWGKQNYIDTFGEYFYGEIKDKEIFNVGVVYTDYLNMVVMCQNIFMLALRSPHNPICDQAIFNYLVRNSFQPPPEYSEIFFTINQGLAIHLGTTMDPNKIEQFRPLLKYKEPIWKNNNIYSQMYDNEFMIPIVHQWDRVPELKTYYIEKYKD